MICQMYIDIARKNININLTEIFQIRVEQDK